MKYSFLSILVIMSIHLTSCNDEPQEKPIPLETGVYLEKVFLGETVNLPYRILYPEGINEESAKFPIVFFLHGAGERGSNNSSQLTHGGELFLDSINEYPAIVVFPQCAASDWWANNSKGAIISAGFPRFEGIELEPSNPSMAQLELLIDSLTNTDVVDKSRIYVTGLSMGGMGTAQLLAKRPNFFAGSIVIAGIAPLEYSDELRTTPTWIFHGLDDNVVLASHGREYFEAIDDGLQTHRYTGYEGVGHVSWDRAFAEPEFLSWLFSKRR